MNRKGKHMGAEREQSGGVDGERRARAALAGLVAVALWTLAVAYLLPPGVGSNGPRLAGYLVGGVVAFWVGWRSCRRLTGP